MGLREVLQGKPLGHPSHPTFVHFPTALLPTSLLFDVLSWAISEPELVRAAFYNVAVGMAGALWALLTGFVDYFGMVPDSRKHRVTTWHMLANLPLMLIFATSLGLRSLELDATRTPLLYPGTIAGGTATAHRRELPGGRASLQDGHEGQHRQAARASPAPQGAGPGEPEIQGSGAGVKARGL